MLPDDLHDNMWDKEVIDDPYTYYGLLRERDPIHWNEQYEVWIITSHADVVWVTRYPELLSSAIYFNDSRPPYPQIDESDLGLFEYARRVQGDQFIQHDRPGHLDMRKALHEFFLRRSLESWRPLVKAAIKDLLDESEGLGRMDVMRDFATPLPVFVISEMMGVPRQDRPLIRSLTQQFVRITYGETDRMKVADQGLKGLMEYVESLVQERQSHPGDDLVSVVLGGERSGAFNRHQVLVNLVLLLVAGHETTVNLLCNGLLALVRNPKEWHRLKSDPTLVESTTEECLRFDSPIKSLQRIAADDVVIREKTLRKGDRVRWFIASANRDPMVFDRPDEFDITRHPNPHVAFGSGIHHCLGAYLGRMEGQEAFAALAQRFDSLELDGDNLEYAPSIAFRSLTSLPITWA